MFNIYFYIVSVDIQSFSIDLLNFIQSIEFNQMISYMDLIQQCFYSSTGWSWDNTYEHILATPRNLLQFPIPNGVTITVSNRNTENNYSSININQIDRLEGSLSYLSSSTNLKDCYKSSKNLPISNVLQGYRDILSDTPNSQIAMESGSLLYGKMYFPSQFLEGMFIKRFSPNYQLIVKFVNTPKLNKLTQPTSIFTFYLQRQTENSSHDFIYSTREDLFGFRCLYHFNLLSSDSKLHHYPNNHLNSTKSLSNSKSAFKHPSKLSAGCELWYAAENVSPGLSFAARYTTYIDSMHYLINNLPTYSNLNPYFTNHPNHNGIRSIPYAISSVHPLTFTMAVNPLLGTFESTYAIKSDAVFKGDNYHGNNDISYLGKMGVVLSSKYQFNMYSYDSDLIVGAQILRSKLSFFNKKNQLSHSKEIPSYQTNSSDNSTVPKYPLGQQQLIHNLSHISQHNIVYKVSEDDYNENNLSIPDSSQFTKEAKVSPIKTSDIRHAEDDEYISSLKISGSLTKKSLRLAWEGKFYQWFVSSGASVDMIGIGDGPRVLKYGVEFSYNS